MVGGSGYLAAGTDRVVLSALSRVNDSMLAARRGGNRGSPSSISVVKMEQWLRRTSCSELPVLVKMSVSLTYRTRSGGITDFTRVKGVLHDPATLRKTRLTLANLLCSSQGRKVSQRCILSSFGWGRQSYRHSGEHALASVCQQARIRQSLKSTFLFGPSGHCPRQASAGMAGQRDVTPFDAAAQGHNFRRHT